MTERADDKPVVVIGGGITGLAAGFELHNAGVPFVVLEASGRTGGKILTTDFAGRPVDEGGDAFLARVPWATDFARELGLGDQLISPEARSAAIWADGLHALPSPNVLGIPLDPDTVAGGLLSEGAADAVRADLARTDPDPVQTDDTVGSLIRRRLGDEVHERLVDPLLGAINAGDTDRLALDAASPQLAAAAAKGPSLIQGLLDARKGSDPTAPVFHSLPSGVQTLADAAAAVISGHIRCDAPVTSIDADRTVRLGDEAIAASAVVLAVPADAGAALVRAWPVATKVYDSVELVSVALLTLAYRPEDVPVDHAAMSGFLVPRSEHPTITACSFASSKWPHLGDDLVILRVSVGHASADDIALAPDDEILATVTADLETTLGITARPAHVRITRWARSWPQYSPGHLDRVQAIETALHPTGVFPVGMAFRGIGIPACINQGRSAARLAAAFSEAAASENPES